MSEPFDVAIVGASVAGCATARLFGQAGARVALIEKRPDTEAYKVVCTHAILSSASPTIDRMGLAPLLEARGVPRVAGDAWTPYSGWIRAPDDAPRGWGVTRRTLDPLVRKLAADTPGVDLISGRTATGAFPGGIEVSARDGSTITIQAPLVVGADGRHSTVARLARVPGRVRPNNRFAYFAYWRGVQPDTDRARVWLLDPDGAAHFPNEDGLAVMVTVAHRSRLPEFRADLEGAYMRTFDGLEDGPDFSGAECVSKMIGSLEHANVMRPAARPGLAFVGDAAVSADPLFGVGLSWAFQSAEWLVRCAAPALRQGSGLDAALDRYRRRLRRELGLHHFLMSEYSTGRRMHSWERAGLAAVPRDDRLLHAFEEVASRRRSPLRLLDPRLAPSAVRALALRG